MPGSEPGDVVAAQQPPARERAQRPAERLGPHRAAVVARGSSASTASAGTANTSVGVARNAERHVVAARLQPARSARRPPPRPGCWWRRRRRRSCRSPASPAGRAASARAPGPRPAGRRRPPGRAAPSAAGAPGRPASRRPRWARLSTRSQIAGRSRSTAATRAPHRISEGSGPISAPAPSTATVWPSAAASPGWPAPASTASATVGSTTPACDPVVDAAADLVAAQPLAAVGQHELVDRLAAAADLDAARARRRGRSRPLGERVLLAVASSDPHPLVQRLPGRPAATVTAASGEASPASTSRRKCTR